MSDGEKEKEGVAVTRPPRTGKLRAPWAKGESGNPGGRAKGQAGIAKMIRKETKDGKELVDYSLRILRDERADWKARADARDWLGNYAFGRAPQTVNLTDDRDEQPPPPLDWKKLTNDELAAYVELHRKMGTPVDLGDGADAVH